MLLTRIIAAACLVAFAPDPTPSIVVPNFSDLTLRRSIASKPGHQGLLETWYFKGSRVREERPVGPQEDPAGRIWVNLTQCDKNAYFFWDDQEKTYQQWSVKDRITGDDDFGNPGDGEVVVTYDSVDTGERRQVGNYSAQHIKTTTTIAPGENSGVRPGKIESDGWYIELPGWDLCSPSKQEPWWQIELEPGHGTPRFIHRWRGVHHGFAIELKTKNTPGVYSPPIEFLGVSEEPLDRVLFDLPKDYTRIAD